MVHRIGTRRRARTVGLLGALGAALVLLGLNGATAFGTTNLDPSQVTAKKVFVCKFVGKPDVDERPQTGNNPIDVSINSVKDFQGPGSFFNDAQGRSLVLAYDVGQPEPDVSDCVSALAPTTTTAAPTTTTIASTTTTIQTSIAAIDPTTTTIAPVTSTTFKF